jgi:HD-GYP domain-containing protein (c-di-GMP phosphodiesterase class II)
MEKVLNEVESRSGTHFDPQLVEQLIGSGVSQRISLTPPVGVPVVELSERRRFQG